jgi:hypothetical protein
MVGFPALAPDLADGGGGYHAEFYPEMAALDLAFVHFFELFWIFFRLPWQGRYCLPVAHDRRSPEL